MPANMDDFLGEGVNELADAPAETEEERARRRAAADARAEAARLADIPYGTPIEQGGTASTYELIDQNMGTHSQPASQQTVRLLNGTTSDGTGGAFEAGTDRILEDAGIRSDEGAKDRRNALQDVIDRMTAAGKLDTTQQQESRRVQQEAAAQNRQLFAKASSYDPAKAAQQFGEESLSHALAIARSAPGGATRETALMNALESAPGLAAEGQRQANAEARSQQNVALQASSQLGQLAGQTRAQDEGQAEAFTGIGLDVAKQIANFTGLNLNLDQRDREFLGEVALQTAQLDLDVEKLGVDESLRRLELQLQKEGLDQEWKQFKASQKITGKDILGGIFGLAGSVTSGLFTGLAAKK